MINFPKLKFSKNTAITLLVIIGIFSIFHFVLFVPFLKSLILSCLFVLLFLIFLVIYRRKKYYKFIKNIGTSVSSETFFSGEYLMAAIPFKKIAIACNARVEGNKLLFGRSPVFRAVILESIDQIEFESFFGHNVAKLTLLNKSDVQSSIYIPWSSLLEQDLEIYKST